MYGLWLYKELKTGYGHCRVEVFRKGYTASAIEIGALVGNSLNLALENLDTITAPIGKSVCSFEIYDTEQFEYDDLFTPDATAYKVVVSTKVDGGEYNTRWSGYVTPDFFAENLSFRTPISISARDNIGYLNDVDFDLDAATITVRELIQAAFNRIAEDYPMSLSFVTQKQTAEGILAIDATISTYLLREMSWYEALETILHDLGLQMRWVDNNTIAVLDISQLGENFGIQRFNFIERSGYREILPAWRELSQKQDYGLRENFFEGRMKSNQLSFVKSVKIDTPLTALGQDVRYYIPTNWEVARDIYTTDPTFYNSSFGNRLIFSAVSEEYPSTTYLSWKTNILKSNVPLTIRANALNTILVPTGGVTPYPLELKVYDPMKEGGGEVSLQIGLKFNLFLHTRDNKTYLMNKEWVEDNGTGSGNFINIVLDKVSLDDYSYTEGKGFFPIGSSAQEQEITITANTIPYDGELELRIYGYFIQGYKWHTDESYWNPNFGKFFTYIDNLTYTFDGHDISTGQDAKVTVAELHNIKEDRNYSFGQVPLDCGGINAYAGGLFKANGDELVGFKRNVDGSTYPLLELVGREIIHFNKKNYNKLSGTIKNLAKEPLRFDRMFIYKGKNYLPFAYSLDVISNTMNITTMQEVEPYMTYSFVEIKSELVTGGGATISGGNNTALQYSAEVGNAKRISELNNASESEKKESYIVIDNANWNESKKVPLSEMEGLDAEQVEEYLTENKYAKQSWVKGITDDLETDIANRVLIEDFEKLQEAVDLNYTNLNKATTRISTLEGYFSNGVANNAAKLGGQLPSYYATKSALDTTNTNLSNLSTTVGTIAGNLSSLTGRVSTAEDTIKGHTSSINKAVADIAANAKNISTNATNITTVANRVKTLEDLGFILKDGYIYTEKTIVSKGEIISGRRASGASTDVGGGGGISSITAQMIADALGYMPYSSANPAGYITADVLTKANVGLGEVQNYGVFNQTSFKGKIQYAIVNSSVLEIANRIDFHVNEGSADYEVSLRVASGETTKRVIYLPSAEGTLALVSQIPTALKSPYALTFGTKTYDGSEAKTITAADLGALTAHQDISQLLSKDDASKTYQPIISLSNKLPYAYISGTPSLATVATSGKYSDLSGLPTIPTNNNQLTNGAGYITSAALNGYATQSWVEGKKYLTAIPSEYVTETELSNTLGGYQTKITSSNKLAYSLISGTPTLATVATSGKYSDLSGVPTSLPASDVYAWAKAAAKPTYTFNEITNKPTTLGGYGITDALPLSGGTIGALVVSGTLDTTGNATIGGVLVAKGGRLRVNASNTANSFGFLKATAYTSSLNRAVLDIGSNYGGSSNVASESVDVTALSIYRGVVGVGRAYTYEELYANYNSNTKLYVDGGIANTRTHSASHWDALKIISIGSWSAAPNYVNGIGVTDGSGVVGRFGISFNGTEGGYFSVRDLYTNAGGYASSGEIFKVVGNGNVYVYGNMMATGEVISSRRAASSDRRLKNNITYLDTTDCLAMVRHIRPAEWDWKDDGKHSMGFIAQDVEQYMPYAVTSIKDDVLVQKLNLQYDQFIALAIGGVQAVDNEVQQLKKEVKELKEKLAKYEHNGNYRN